MGDVMNQVEEVKGVKVLAISLEGVDMNGLRDLGDQLKEKMGEGVILLASSANGKVSPLRWTHSQTHTDTAHIKQGSSCRQPDQGSRFLCSWWRRWTSEHGAGWRKESGRNRGCSESCKEALEEQLA